MIAEGRDSAAILEITQIADVGLGSFYNHFASKEELSKQPLTMRSRRTPTFSINSPKTSTIPPRCSPKASD